VAFGAGCVGQWAADLGSQTISIASGHPWDIGCAERFIGTLRDKCLNEEVLWGARHAQAVVAWWRREVNPERPHRSVNYRTPGEAVGRVRSLKEGAWDASGGCASTDSPCAWNGSPR